MMQQLRELLHLHILLHLLIALAIIALWRVKPPIPRRRLLWLTIPFVLLSIICIPVVCYFALGSLEWHYPPLAERPGDADAIVVLAGYVKPPDAIDREPQLGINTFYRCMRAAELYQQGRPMPIVVSGGSISGGGGPTCADAMRVVLLRLGVAPEDIVCEGRSRTTYENAAACSDILRQRGLMHAILVTDATHLWRSELCFRKQGVELVPCGCYYRAASSLSLRPIDFVPDATVLEDFEQVVHEWVGLAWYWVTGKI